MLTEEGRGFLLSNPMVISKGENSCKELGGKRHFGVLVKASNFERQCGGPWKIQMRPKCPQSYPPSRPLADIVGCNLAFTPSCGGVNSQRAISGHGRAVITANQLPEGEGVWSPKRWHGENIFCC